MARRSASTDILNVRFFAPPDYLEPYFTTIYRLDVKLPPGETVTDYLQPEWANMRFFSPVGPQARIDAGSHIDKPLFQASGSTSMPVHFTLESTRLWGVGLLPLGWATFMDVPADSLVNWLGDGNQTEAYVKHRPLYDAIFDGEPNDRREYGVIIDHFERLYYEHPDKKRILAVHESMVDPYLTQVTDLAERVDMSTRTLERLCRRYFGFSPSLLLRRQRLMRTLAAFMLDHEANWTEVIDRHYHDQSHFVREFHKFMGMSPGVYGRLEHPILGAFMLERQRIWGSPVQTLDRPVAKNGRRGATDDDEEALYY